MSPKIIDKQEKKGHIIRAALAVFARRGFAKAKMSDVAEMAGLDLPKFLGDMKQASDEKKKEKE